MNEKKSIGHDFICPFVSITPFNNYTPHQSDMCASMITFYCNNNLMK